MQPLNRIPIINIQEAYALFLAQSGGVPKTAELRPPYDTCILMFTPFDGTPVLTHVRWTPEWLRFQSFDLRSGHKVIPFSQGKLPNVISADVPFNFDSHLDPATDLSDPDSLLGLLPAIFSFALNLMNCKNIRYVPFDSNTHLSKTARRKRERTGAAPFLKYEILEIEPMRDRTIVQGDSVDSQDAHVPIHTVRGHFKTYTEERPLFGKITGTFWWGACVKGNADIGLIEKDYSIRLNLHVLSQMSEQAGGDTTCS